MATPDSILGIQLTLDDKASVPLKAFESSVIRTVGAISAALAAISAIGFPISAAINFQKEMLNVKKTTDLSYESINALSKELVQLSLHTNQSATDLAKMAEMGGRMGMADKGVETLLEFVRQVSLLSTALDLSAEETSLGMGKLTNLFNLNLQSFAKAGAVINQLDNESTANASQLFDIMQRMGNLGGSVSLAQSAALAATAVDLGMTAETAGTTYTKIFANMKSKAAEFAAFMGMTTEQWVSFVQTDGVEALRAFLAQLNKMPVEVAASTKIALAGGGRIFEFVTKLQNQIDQGPTSVLALRLKSATEEWERGTSAVKEQQSVLSGVAAQWEIFKNKLSKVALEVGEKTLYGLTKALIAVGDVLSDQRAIDAFVAGIQSIVSSLGSLFTFLQNLTSGMKVPWTEILQVGAMLLAVKAVNALRAALMGLPNTVSGLVGISNPATLAAKQKDTTGAGNASAGELNAIGVMRLAYEKYLAQHREAIRLKQEAARADAQAAAAVAAATEERNRTDRTVSVSKSTKSSALKALEAARQADIAAEEYIASRIAAQNQQKLLLEEQYNTARAAIVGKGSVAKRGLLKAQHDAEMADLEKAQARQLRGYQLHYSQLKAMAERQRVNAESWVALSTDKVGAALAGSSAARTTLIDARKARSDTAAALAAAAAEVEKGPFKRLLTGIQESFTRAIGKPIASLGTSFSILTGQARIWSTISTVAQRDTLIFGAALKGLGAAATIAATSIGLLSRALFVAVNVGLRLLGWVGIAILFYDIGKAALEMFGLLTPLVNVINKLIDGFNRLSGMKVGKILTSEQIEKNNAELRQTIDETKKANAAAEAFSKAFGKVDSSKGLEEGNKQLAEMAKKLQEADEAVAKGVKMDIFKGNDGSQALINGLKTVGLIGSALKATTLEIQKQKAAYGENNAALDEQEAIITSVNEKLAANKEAEARLATLGGLASPTVSTRIEEDRVRLTKELNDATAKHNELLGKQSSQAESLVVLTRTRALQEEYYDKIFNSVASGFDSSFLRDILGNGSEIQAQITKLQELDAEVKRLTITREEAAKKLANAQASPSGSSKEAPEYKADAAAEADLKKATEDYNKMAETLLRTEAIIRAAPAASRGSLLDALKTVGTGKELLESLGRTAQKTGTTIASAFKGLSSLPATKENYAALMGQLVLAQAGKEAFGRVASAAKAAAEEAKNAVARALNQTKQDLEALRRSAIDNEMLLRQNKDAAASTQAGRAVDEDAARRLVGIEHAKRLELEILDLKWQGAQDTEKYASQRLEIEQRYARQIARVNDQGADTKAKGDAERQLKLFEESRAKATALLEEMSVLSKKMNDMSIPADTRMQMTEPFEEAKAKAMAYIDAMKQVQATILGMRTSTGQPIISKEKLSELEKAIASATTSKNTSSTGVARSAAELATNAATQAEKTVKQFQTMETAAINSLTAIAIKTEKSLGQVGLDIAKLAASPAFVDLAKSFETLGDKGTISIGSVSFDDKALEKARDYARAQGEAAFKELPVSVDTKELDGALKTSAEKFTAMLRGITPKTDGSVGETVPTLKVDPDISKEATQQKLTDMGQLSLKATAYVTEIVQPDGTTTKTAVKVPGFKEGGPILGAGNGTSDSILMWGSHGEYMVDALTTRTFGTGFFRTLQAIAKSGRPSDMLTRLLPGLSPAIATVGMPSLAAAEGGGEGVANVQAVDITFNRKKVGRVMGSRDTLNTLVTALQDVARGT